VAAALMVGCDYLAYGKVRRWFTLIFYRGCVDWRVASFVFYCRGRRMPLLMKSRVCKKSFWWYWRMNFTLVLMLTAACRAAVSQEHINYYCASDVCLHPTLSLKNILISFLLTPLNQIETNHRTQPMDMGNGETRRESCGI
jgi:hypothetical protein